MEIFQVTQDTLEYHSVCFLFRNFSDPLMSQCMIGSDPQFRVSDEALRHEVFCFWGDTVPNWLLKFKFANFDAIQDLTCRVAIEGGLARQKDVTNYTSRPNIAFSAIIEVDHFRRDIIGCSNAFMEMFLIYKNLSGSKIYHFYLREVFVAL